MTSKERILNTIYSKPTDRMNNNFLRRFPLFLFEGTHICLSFVFWKLDSNNCFLIFPALLEDF